MREDLCRRLDKANEKFFREAEKATKKVLTLPWKGLVESNWSRQRPTYEVEAFTAALQRTFATQHL